MTDVEDSIGAQDTVYYLAYGAWLHPKHLASRLGTTLKPVSSCTVRVPSAWLSFSVRGIPFVEPCACNAIVQGVNDQSAGSASAAGDKKRQQDAEEYKRWVWVRCCPGLEYTGSLPPSLEGVAYELTREHFERVITQRTGDESRSAAGAANSSRWPADAPHQIVQVDAVVFDSATGQESRTVKVYMPVITDETGLVPNLQPTLRYLRLVLLGAHFSTLSQPFLGHLTLLRPFSHSLTLRKTLASYIVTILLLPQFVLVHLPTVAFRTLFGRGSGGDGLWSSLGRTGLRLERTMFANVERCLCLFAGSGYRND